MARKNGEVRAVLEDLQRMADAICTRAVEIMEDPAVKGLPQDDRDRLVARLHSLSNYGCTVRDLRAELADIQAES